MAKESKEDLDITIDEIRAFRKEILLMHGVLAGDMIEENALLKSISDFFVNKGLDKAWLDKLLASFIGTEMAEDRELLLSYVLEELDSYIVTESELEPIGKKIHILIGATGVGKTTLIGKLGARYSYFLDKPYSVAFCAYDNVKLGALDQLLHYSDIMDISMVEFENLIDKDNYDIILVDTAGSRGDIVYDLTKLVELIENYSEYKMEISIVLSATAKERDMIRMMKLFQVFPIDNFIFTKLDETDDIGDMMRFLMQYQKPINYLSIGPDIPEDLIVATNEYILQKFMSKEKSE